MLEAVDLEERIQPNGGMEIFAGEAVAAAQVLENGAPDKHVHGVHQIRRGIECAAQCGVGPVELTRGDIRASGRYARVGAALRCKCGDK